MLSENSDFEKLRDIELAETGDKGFLIVSLALLGLAIPAPERAACLGAVGIDSIFIDPAPGSICQYSPEGSPANAKIGNNRDAHNAKRINTG